MATSMKDLVGDPLDDFAKKFTDEFIQLGIRTDNRYRSSPVRGGGAWIDVWCSIGYLKSA